MSTESSLSPHEWIDKLAQEELPAITSIALVLDKFSSDDLSSIPELSKVILHDQSLSACLLRVANSSHYSPVNKVTTVSRAAIVLGVHAVKNICLTAKILEMLLQNKNLQPEVYDRIMRLMANGFYAGQLARFMVPDHDERTQEEVYLAAMLQHIGETAFWSSGSELTSAIITKASLPREEYSRYCTRTLGVSFDAISIGLAKTWGLGNLLIKSLDAPETRTREVQIVSLANQLAEMIARPPSEKWKFEQVLKNIAQLMNTTTEQVARQIENTRRQATELLSSYGFPMLEEYILPLPNNSDFGKDRQQKLKPESKEELLLALLQELTQLTQHSKNVNEYLSLSLRKAAEILHIQRLTFWILATDRRALEARLTYDGEGHAVLFTRTLPLPVSDNVIKTCMNQGRSVMLTEVDSGEWATLMTAELEEIANRKPFYAAPVKVGARDIGIVTASMTELSELEQYSSFSGLSMIIEHLNLCLSTLTT